MSRLKLKKRNHQDKTQGQDEGIGLRKQNDTSTAGNKRLFAKAIASAEKHGINLEPGRANAGHGNCSYESAIFNINDRECFSTKLPMSPDFYRRVWNIDLMNKILDRKIPWNPGLSRDEIRKGFEELMESGVYERSFFGDLMMAGIACGIRKRILIFHTNVGPTVHDPISVVDPRDYGGHIDSDIPVVVGYNLVHYESLHPLAEEDVKETVRLVNSYSCKPSRYRQEYGFKGSDLQNLTSSNIVMASQEESANENPPKTNQKPENGMSSSRSVIDSPSYKDRECKQIQSPPPQKTKYFEKADATKKNYKNSEIMGDFIFEDICFKETETGKIICGVCDVECSKLIVHMNGNEYCTKYFSNMFEFKRKYSEFRDKLSKSRNTDKRKAEIQDKDKNEYRKTHNRDDIESQILIHNTEAKSSQTTEDSKSESSYKDRECKQIQSPPPKKPKYFEKADATKKIYENSEKMGDFMFEGICFKETETGKICCGVCEVECSRLIVHMNGNEYCTAYFSNMSEFKRKYSEFRDKLSRSRNTDKRKAEMQDTGKNEKQTCNSQAKSHQTTCDGKSETGQVTAAKSNMDRAFSFGGFEFKELGDGKIRCAICQIECIRLVYHLNGSVKCAEMFSMPDFKTEYSRYRSRQRVQDCKSKQKAADPQGFKDNANKIEQDRKSRKKAADPQGFKDNAKKSVQECKSRKKAADPQGFKDNANKIEQDRKSRKKAADPQGFKDNANKIEQDRKSRKKAADPQGFKDNAKKSVQECKSRKKAADPQGFKDNANKIEQDRKSRKKAADPQGFKDRANVSYKKCVTKKKDEDLKGFKANTRERKAKSNSNVTADKRLFNFRRRVRYGPIFICSCCHQKLFENQVEQINNEMRNMIDNADPGIRAECIEEEIMVDLGRKDESDIFHAFLCKSCKWYLIRGKMPKFCTKNGLSMDAIQDGDQLSELENNLIARNIIFQKIHKLPKSRWSGTHDRLINVPVGPDDIINTVQSLPRTPAEAGIIPIIPVNLKRKLEYKTTHLSQLIDTNKIFKYLDYLKEMGHPGYKFYDDLNTYEKRCVNEDPIGSKLVFPEAEAEIVDLDIYLSELKNEPKKISNGVNLQDQLDEIAESDMNEKEEEEYVKKDPIRKFQYDYNKSTCMTNKFPEADSSSALEFAPAEGKIPTSILKDKDWDINSFPNLHPTGQNKMFQDREIKLTPQQYLAQRLKNKDNRFEQCTPYVFAAAAFVEEKQMERNIGVSYNKGKKIELSDGSKSYELDDAFSVLDNIKCTPKYWKKAKGEMLGKIDNFGPFHWFYTLSCADMRWEENFTSILREKGYKIIWEQIHDEDVIVKVEFDKAGVKTKKLLKTFLEKECDESLHEFIRTNVFTATRNFINRVRSFRTEIMMGTNNPMRIKYWSDKMEFQGRGAGHIHGVAWCDLKEVSELIKEERKVGIILSERDTNSEEDDVNHLENAYKSLRENESLSTEEENALIDFVDRTVTCTLNPELAAKMIDVNKTREDGLKIIEIVKEVQVHYHTKSCKKHGCTTACRFRFPKFPMWKTIMTKSQVFDENEDARNEREDKNRKVLEKVMTVLETEEVIEEIMSEYNKEMESIDEYRQNRKQRILKVLELADVDPDDYVAALKESSRKGINVILARDIDELYVNNYVPEYILVWNGNIDWSAVFDFFAVVTYVTEYFTKDESGTSSFLAEASKQIKNLPVKDQQRCIKNVFLTHRQMGLSEAFMKIFPDIRLKDSNISSVFVPLGKKEDISRYLMRADPDQDYGSIELLEITNREGLYYEKPNWVDKYLRRDRSKWDELCFPQYVKMFDPIQRNQSENQDEEQDIEYDADIDNPDGQDLSDLERDIDKYGQEVKFHYLITETGEMGKQLPKLMKIGNPYPGEPNFLRKRKHPKSLRFYKVKRELNPARFFLHELMMYRHFGQEEYDRWQDDQNCIEDYELYKENIKKVKAKVMEWMEDVEEARYFVEEVMKNEVNVEETGANMDPEMHQEDLECDLEGIEEDDRYIHLDPEGLKEHDIPNLASWYRKLEVKDLHVLEQESCKLDKWQRKVVDVGLKFAKGIKKHENSSTKAPKPENLVVIGGAGSGKSTVIECLTQWCHRILVKAGDDPNSPYILKAATTGAASSLIEGSTVHSSLGFDHSSKHTSLSDKKREMKRDQLHNLKILIIDEFSMMKADILYRIHLRLCEIKNSKKLFGGVNVYLFGDPAQLKPVRGSYIFAAPNCPDYKLAYGDGTDSLWKSFSVINLEENHRQGNDKSYADMLNRIRVGKHTQDDIEILKSRIRPKDHADLKGALFISAKVAPVAKFNEIALAKTKGRLYVSRATHIQAMSKSYKPRIDKKSGRIGDTHYVDELKLKIGARVMLIYNIDVSDLLTNGTIGTVVGVTEGNDGVITAVIIKFDNPEAGKQARSRNPLMAKKYPQGTVVKKMEIEYSLARHQGLISTTAKLIQFPLVLAWAVTAHKIQGQSIKSPQKVVVDLKSVFEAAQAYVMLSRVQELDQLYILKELPENKIYANQTALAEIDRLLQVSKNNNPTEWECRKDDSSKTRVTFLNSRSIRNKFKNIKSDRCLLMSDIIFLSETWLEEDTDGTEYSMKEYTADFNSNGRGKGIASYYKENFKHVTNIKCEGFSVSKLESKNMDMIGVYRSQGANDKDLLEKLKMIIDNEKITIIGGDMNVCVRANPENHITKSLTEVGFKQIVSESTHIEGGVIDHIYLSQNGNIGLKWIIEYFPKYYSDHDGLGLILYEEKEE